MDLCERPKWQFELAGSGIVLRVESAPNAFHRFIQGWLLGIRWTRL